MTPRDGHRTFLNSAGWGSAEVLPLAFVMTAVRCLAMALLVVNARLYALGRV